MSRYDHRVNWRREASEKGYRCTAPGCWEVAKTTKAMQVHADVHEGSELDTDGLIEEQA